jgi:hypothetical protein
VRATGAALGEIAAQAASSPAARMINNKTGGKDANLCNFMQSPKIVGLFTH